MRGVLKASGPTGVILDELKSGALAAVRVDGFAVTRGFHLVTREESLLGPAAKAFRDFCLE